MSALVAELVELARGDRQPQDPEDVRLDLVAADAIERTRRNRPGVEFSPELEETLVRGVPSTIERAVSNLLDNAAKWSPPGGTIDVTVRDGELVVRDHGPGISEEDVPFVFDRFYRAPSARSMPGSGLGLAIVRQVAEAHGGTVAVEAPEGGGTQMRLTLPSRERRRLTRRARRVSYPRLRDVVSLSVDVLRRAISRSELCGAGRERSSRSPVSRSASPSSSRSAACRAVSTRRSRPRSTRSRASAPT